MTTEKALTEKQIAVKLYSLTKRRDLAYGVYSRARGRNTKNLQSMAEQRASERLRQASHSLMAFCRAYDLPYPVRSN